MMRIGLGALFLLASALIATIVAEAVPAAHPPPAMVPLRPAPSHLAEAAVEGPGGESARVAQILARPLFARSRRPAHQAAPSRAVLRLTGVIIGPGGREAIFEPVAGGKPRVVKEGERVDGALVKAIAPGAVLMVDQRGAHLISPAYAPSGPARSAASR